MNDEQRYQRIQQLFLEACALNESERTGFLERACADDERIEVERLLKHDAAPAEFVDSAESGAAIHKLASGMFSVDSPHELSAPLPERIGRYRIIRRIGHGGMGVVYEAEQDEPRRRVAIKVLRSGSSSPAVVRRFRHEAQALAHLHHPGIAQVFDVGADESGQPFIVMEMIDGSPLLEYAGTHGLSFRARLELVAEICDAVHHAHQRGIIHRDLKPGNILVESRDASSASTFTRAASNAHPLSAQPRILDFGIARITDEDLRSVTQQTTVGEVIGTVPYMSPEQTTGDPNALDTRSDVYAIGVVMFELLTGRLPIDVRQSSMHEAIRAVQSDEPVRLRTLDQRIADDVETIAAKALEKDKARRYQSAAELGTDIRRFLADQPILARPPSAMYQMRKFARRNRALAIGAAVAMAGLVLATLISITLAAVAIRAEQRQSKAREDAEIARDEADAASEFLADMLGAADPNQMGKDVRVIDVLARAASEIPERFPKQPAVRSQLHRSIGISYRNLGLLAEAEIALAAAVEDAKTAYDPDHPALLRALNSLAVLYDDQERYDQSVGIYQQILAIQQRTLGRTNRDALGTACNLGLTMFDLGQYDDARRMLETTLVDMRSALGPQDGYTLNCLQGLGSVNLAQERLEDAEAAFSEVLATASEAIGPNCNQAISAASSLSEVHMRKGDAGGAVRFNEDAMNRALAALPADHWKIGRLLFLQGAYLIKLERFAEAEQALLKAHANLVSNFGNEGSLTQSATMALVELFTTWGRAELAAEWQARLQPEPEPTTRLND